MVKSCKCQCCQKNNLYLQRGNEQIQRIEGNLGIIKDKQIKLKSLLKDACKVIETQWAGIWDKHYSGEVGLSADYANKLDDEKRDFYTKLDDAGFKDSHA